mmetsp:Transcript_92870/g.248472  ORF Transcript_92870/g.248472 Transcript_92870/m.248472 type:complete len:296 (-) Transcript_92870:12-899(-)
MGLDSVVTAAVLSCVMKARDGVAVFGIDLPYTEKQVKAHMKDIMAYKLFALAVLAIWLFVQEFSLSSFITLASAVQGFAFLLLARQAGEEGSMRGISRKMLFTYALALCFRLWSTLFYLGYLPVDYSGYFVYQGTDVLTLLVVVNLLSKALQRYPSADEDSFWVSVPIAGALVLGWLVHPNLDNVEHADAAWMSSLWLEAAAFCPQIWMVSRAGRCRSLTAHFVALSFASRCIVALFWLEAHPQLGVANHWTSWDSCPSCFVLAAYSCQVLVISDFMFAYLRSARRPQMDSVMEL